MGTLAAPQAGNTTSTLISTPVELAATITTDPAAPAAPVDTTEPKTLDQVKADFAAKEAAKAPKPSAPAPATGPAPIEWKAPVVGGKSPAFPPSELDGSSTLPRLTVTSAAQRTKAYVTFAEFDALVARIENFNNRSSQKI